MTARMLCPKCRNKISLEDINVSTDVVLCRRCGETWKYSELLEEGVFLEMDLGNPPKGVWFKQNPPNGFEVGTTTRSFLALFLIPFMCFWSGGSLGGIYGTQIVHHKFDWRMSAFGIPFLIGTFFLGGVSMMSVFGKTLIRVEGDNGLLFTGVGSIGWCRRFKWSDITSIRTTEGRGSKGSVYQQITLYGKKTYNFASSLREDRRKFMIGALQKMRRNSGR
jgi:hypothetical protein